MVNQRFMAEKPFYNRRPLGKEGWWQHDERLPSKVAKNAAKHQQRLSQTHFIGNNTATNSKLGFLIHFSAKTPLQTCNLVRFLLKIDPWKPFAKSCQRLSNTTIQVACNNCRPPPRPNRYRPPFRQNRYRPPFRQNRYRPLFRQNRYRPLFRQNRYFGQTRHFVVCFLTVSEIAQNHFNFRRTTSRYFAYAGLTAENFQKIEAIF